MSIDGLVDTAAAARLLGVSARRVTQLADAGDIVRANRGLYDRLSIESYSVARRATGERAWDAATAWAAVAILARPQHTPEWVSDSTIYRLERALRTMTAGQFVGKARDRAKVHVFTGHPSVAEVIRTDVVVRAWEMVGLAGGTDGGVDGYVSAADLQGLVERYALVGSTSGNVTLRATSFDMGIVRSVAEASDALVALDAAGSIDPRARGVGEHVLERALARHREGGGGGR